MIKLTMLCPALLLPHCYFTAPCFATIFGHSNNGEKRWCAEDYRCRASGGAIRSHVAGLPFWKARDRHSRKMLCNNWRHYTLKYPRQTVKNEKRLIMARKDRNQRVATLGSHCRSRSCTNLISDTCAPWYLCLPTRSGRSSASTTNHLWWESVL